MRVKYLPAVVAEEKSRTTVAEKSRGEDEDELAGWPWLRLVMLRFAESSRRAVVQQCGTKRSGVSQTAARRDLKQSWLAPTSQGKAVVSGPLWRLCCARMRRVLPSWS